MTPKEKAKELASKFRGFEMPNEKLASVQCALICVDEILKNCIKDIADAYYWKEVKQEINKL